MKYTDEQLAELKQLGLSDDEIEKLQEAGVEFDAAKAIAEAAETKAKELAESQIRERKQADTERAILERRTSEIASDMLKSNAARRAAFSIENSGGAPVKDRHKDSVEKAMQFGLNPESPAFNTPILKDFGHDKGRVFNDSEKAALWTVGEMLKAIHAKDYGRALGMKEFIKNNWLDEEYSKGLLTTSGNYGGYLVPTEFLNLFVELRYAASPYRQIVTTIPVNSTSGEFPAEVNGHTVYRKAEAAAGTASRAKFRNVTYNITSKWVMTVVTFELLQTNAIGLANWILRDFARAMAAKEWEEFIVGSGSGAPQGLANAGITQTAAAATSPMTFVDVHSAYYALPAQYRDRAVWILRDDRLMSIENVKDGDNRPIFISTQEGLGTFPMRLKGKPVYVNNYITENTAATPKSVIYFGDPSYYYHFELRGLSFDESSEASIVDESGSTVSLFQTNQTAFKAWTNDDAKLALPAAFATLTNVP